MRHHKAHKKLGRDKGGRTALLRSLARSLITRGAIVTTVTRAKELRPFIEKLVTTSKGGTLASQRAVSSALGQAPAAAKKLREEYAERFAKRSGGYTRIVKLGRVGKRVVESARIEFLEK